MGAHAGSKPGIFPPVPFYFKGKLSRLRKQARRLQAKIARIRAARPGRYKHLCPYCKVRREWQRCWNKIHHLHEEMAKQVATRIVAACVHHGVDLLRFEDLLWSSHAPKRDAGSWLAWWQVHWFHGQVQDRAALLARLAGIDVEWADARNTSKRCSRCRKLGSRKGKTFTCSDPACGLRLDADLNAARNIGVARTSPRLHATASGARYHPNVVPVGNCINSEGQDSDVQDFQCLKLR
ncbi:transposase [Candidatus Bathyarchaeota archaeon]|nr:transposase [Candidatus Bathyarchaeota archaeon]